MQDYKKLKVWERSHHLVLSVYDISKVFPKEEIYGITSQLRRATFSIPANIAEGCGKKGKAEFAQFLNISLGSANEAEYFLLLSKDLKFLAENIYSQLFKQINEIKAMLISLIEKVRT